MSVFDTLTVPPALAIEEKITVFYGFIDWANADCLSPESRAPWKEPIASASSIPIRLCVGSELQASTLSKQQAVANMR